MKQFITGLFILVSLLIFIVLAKLASTYVKSNDLVLWWFVAYLIGINGYGFLVMIIDKYKSSRSNKQRISERHLFTTAALGGSLGTLLGMRLARHKTKHVQFKLLLPLLLVIEVFVLLRLG